MWGKVRPVDARQRNSLIDAYRGIAILAVMAYHYTIRWPELYGYAHAYPSWLHFGRYGVHLFFVISGLVITMTVLRAANPVEFAARRFARLYPAFILAAILTYLAMRWGPERFHRGAMDLFASLTMDAHLLGQDYVDGAYWSLAVEVKFYAYVAIARWALKDRFWMGLLGLALASSIPLGASWSYATIAPWWPYFLLGMAGWFFVAERSVAPAIALFLASIALYVVQRPEGVVADVFIWGASLSMLGLLWKIPGWQPWAVRWLAWVGTFSYSLYLLHQNMGVAIIQLLTARGAPDLVAMVVASACTGGLAYLSYRLVELPGNRSVMRSYREVSERFRAAAA
jgi:peptidoglycan/LPS O-acetylase OafA/YrhL